MPKAYISAPFTSKSVFTGNRAKAYGEIKDESYKNFLEAIDSAVRECGVQTTLPHRDTYNWGTAGLTPEELMQKAFEGVKSSDVLIAYPEASKGVNVLIGWASSLKKKIVILVNEKEKISVVHSGIQTLTETRIIKFRDIMDLRTKLKACLNEFVLGSQSQR